jgi:hypothetical protein
MALPVAPALPQARRREGFLYLVTGEELGSLDRWERDYQKVEVTEEIEK